MVADISNVQSVNTWQRGKVTLVGIIKLFIWDKMSNVKRVNIKQVTKVTLLGIINLYIWVKIRMSVDKKR